MSSTLELRLFVVGVLAALGCAVPHKGPPSTSTRDGGADASSSSAVAGHGAGPSNVFTSAPGTGLAEDDGGARPDDCRDIDVATATLTLAVNPLAPSFTWSGVIHVTGSLSVDGSAVTIEPGTTFIMDADSGLDFGSDDSATTALFARGTGDRPIRFCGKERKPGYWRGLRVDSGVTSDGLLQNVVVSDAGSQGAGVTLVAPLTVTSLRVIDSSTDGVHASGFHAGSSDLGVEGAARYAAVLFAPDAATHFPLGGTFRGNAENTIRLRFDRIGLNTTFADAGIPYVQEQTVNVRDGATLAFEAGVDYRFAADTSLVVGWNSDDATLQVKGTKDKPIVFEGASPTSGYWQGISIEQNVRSTSKIAYAKILHGGGAQIPALNVDSSITLDHVSLAQNEHGVSLSVPLNSDSTNLSVTGTADVPVHILQKALAGVPAGGDLTGNAHDVVDVVMWATPVVAVAGIVRNVGIPYRFIDSMSLKQGSDLTIEPGTNFLVAADKYIEVGWNSDAAKLVASGTSASPITFRGEQDTAGSWAGIAFRASATGDCRLEHVQVIDAGKVGKAALTLERPMDVANNSFSKSAGYGILKRASDTTAYESQNSFDTVASGDVGTY